MVTRTSLRAVQEGMRVLDSSGNDIGKVEWVQFGDDDPETHEIEARGPSEARMVDGSLADRVASAFRADVLPDEVKARLLHQGFVRVDVPGLFAADRYVTPDQIEAVNAGQVILKVGKEKLVKH